MRVSELIAQLSELDPNMRVIKSKDEEGNGFYQIYHVVTAHVEDPEDSWIEVLYYDDEYEEEYGEPFDADDYTEVAIIW